MYHRAFLVSNSVLLMSFDYAKPNFIALSGAHGCGKTTMLNMLRDMSSTVVPGTVVPALDSIPRRAQAELGFDTLHEATTSNFMKLQDKILDITRTTLEQLAYDNTVYASSEKPRTVFLDRSPIDFYAYSMLWMEQQYGLYKKDVPQDVLQWHVYYTTKCLVLARYYNKLVHVLPDDRIPFVTEARRASEATVQRFVHHAKNFIERTTTEVIEYDVFDNSVHLPIRMEFMIKLAHWPATKPVHNELHVSVADIAKLC